MKSVFYIKTYFSIVIAIFFIRFECDSVNVTIFRTVWKYKSSHKTQSANFSYIIRGTWTSTRRTTERPKSFLQFFKIVENIKIGCSLWHLFILTQSKKLWSFSNFQQLSSELFLIISNITYMYFYFNAYEIGPRTFKRDEF